MGPPVCPVSVLYNQHDPSLNPVSMRDPLVSMRDKTPLTTVPPGPCHPPRPSPPGPVAGTVAAPSTSPAPTCPPHKRCHDLHGCLTLNAHTIRPGSRRPNLHSTAPYLHRSTAHRHRRRVLNTP
ncbi:hypothetical protein GUJ93_ZPchr0011g27126 [Zizania palustris]|uniref:Uncharacterized protein n=1 Tax=Zizania palustris TaxID=103762 RepID=A0A8J6BRU2_ZIZPA|nr:hypothetical protein GUJ93_ZPchr0011g27126 [Zizania palustris]